MWGYSLPGIGMTPYYSDSAISSIPLQTKVWCRPCSKIGYHKCPLGHFKCMEKITVDELWKESGKDCTHLGQEYLCLALKNIQVCFRLFTNS